MQAIYIVRRFGVFLLIIWLAATLNFFLPKLSGQDPVRTKLLQEASLGGYVHAGIEDMVKVLEAKVMPDLRRNRFPDKKTSQTVAQLLHAVARELEV